jgi:hypothetical protein
MQVDGWMNIMFLICEDEVLVCLSVNTFSGDARLLIFCLSTAQVVERLSYLTLLCFVANHRLKVLTYHVDGRGDVFLYSF